MSARRDAPRLKSPTSWTPLSNPLRYSGNRVIEKARRFRAAECPRMAAGSPFFPSLVSSFALLSRVRDLETADRVRCNYPPSGRRGRSVAWPSAPFGQGFPERRTRGECEASARRTRGEREASARLSVARLVCAASVGQRHSLFLARTAIDKAKRLMKYYTVRIYAYQRPSL